MQIWRKATGYKWSCLAKPCKHMYLRLSLLYILLPGWFLSFTTSSHAQQDSVVWKGVVALMGSWQTGNLNQLGINPKLRINTSRKRIKASLQSTYHYMEVEGHSILNDFWNSLELRQNKAQKVVPAMHLVYGLAHSYRINHSLVGGLGAVWKAINSSKGHKLELHGYAGYMDFQLEGTNAHRAPALSSALHAQLTLGGSTKLMWNFRSFHSMQDAAYSGIDNALVLSTRISKKLHLNLSHQLYHHYTSAALIKKTNTFSMIGFNYTF